MDHGIETLLAQDGTVIAVDTEKGYWIKINAHEVEPSKERPHGIKYEMSLHDEEGERLLGFDNAHAIKDERRGQYSTHRKMTKWDHKHKLRDIAVVIPYEYVSAEQLLEDFWAAVDEALNLEGL